MDQLMKNVEQLHREVAVAIVGAGAARVGGGPCVVRANIPYLLIDGRARLGGRAFTEIVNKLPLDLGLVAGCIRPTGTRGRRSPTN